MCKDVINFNNLPEAVSFLINELSEIRLLLEKERVPVNKRVPINIDDACKVLMKSKPTIYNLCSKGKLTTYKKGKRLYFFEDELINFITEGKKKTLEELNNEIESEMLKGIRCKSKSRKL